MAVEYKCQRPEAECAWTEFAYIETTASEDQVRMATCGGCSQTFPLGTFKTRRKP